MESNIDDLLARGSRVVQIQDAEQDGETISKFSFSKTQFHSSSADASLDMSDPDFWAKVLGQDSRETLVTRLKDGTATASDLSKAEFLKEVFELAQEVRNCYLGGTQLFSQLFVLLYVTPPPPTDTHSGTPAASTRSIRWAGWAWVLHVTVV